MAVSICIIPIFLSWNEKHLSPKLEVPWWHKENSRASFSHIVWSSSTELRRPIKDTFDITYQRIGSFATKFATKIVIVKSINCNTTKPEILWKFNFALEAFTTFVAYPFCSRIYIRYKLVLVPNIFPSAFQSRFRWLKVDFIA